MMTVFVILLWALCMKTANSVQDFPVFPYSPFTAFDSEVNITNKRNKITLLPEGECDIGHKRKVGEILHQMVCKPRKTVVHLDTNPFEMVYPSAVEIERCTGSCIQGMKCMPTSTIEVNIPIHQVDLNPSNGRIHGLKCGYIRVGVHGSCACQCPVSPKDCNHMQEYRREECACVCTNNGHKKKCLEQNWRWNQEKCNCECPATLPCSTGLMWVPSLCRCARIMVV